MIRVLLQEKCREFEVHLGKKRVGKVLVYSSSGRCAAYAATDESDDAFLEGFPTLSQATNAILDHLGFGRMSSPGPEVQRAKGGKVR